MKKYLVFGIILILIGVNVSGSFVKKTKDISNFVYDGNILYVGGSGPNNYTSIQDAIDDAFDEDTIFVYDDSAPYYERIVIDKSISLIGEDKNTTIIDGIKSGDVIIILKDNVIIKDFTIYNSGLDEYDSGIKVCSSNNFIIGNIIMENSNGISMRYNTTYGYPKNTIIIYNIVENNECGLNLERSSNNIINENNLSSNIDYGIFLGFASQYNNINKNKITNNRYGIYLEGAEYNTIKLNEISKNYLGIYFNSFWFWTIQVDSTENSVVQNNMLNNRGDASFSYLFSTGNVLQNNHFSQNYWKRPRILPKLIFGTVGLSIPIPRINIDWRPTEQPYEIN